jgi:anti-sigma B factor antagonist
MLGTAMMRIDVERPYEDIVVLAVTGEIDSLTASRLSTALHRELEHNTAMLVVDLTGVSFLGVPGIKVLDCAATRAVCASVPLVLVHPDSPAITAAVRLANLVAVMPTFRTVAQALATWGSLIDTAADVAPRSRQARVGGISSISSISSDQPHQRLQLHQLLQRTRPVRPAATEDLGSRACRSEPGTASDPRRAG